MVENNTEKLWPNSNNNTSFFEEEINKINFLLNMLIGTSLYGNMSEKASKNFSQIERNSQQNLLTRHYKKL